MDARSKAADAVTTGRAAVACCVVLSGLFFCSCSDGASREPIRIGVLHSLSGTMAFSEKPVVEATLLAIEDLNARGGLLGRRVEAVTADAKSDPATFASEAERLITRDKVAALFGCWTSASRKYVRTVVERHNQLLFYPVQYEGLELSPNIVYAGAAPNQQIIPAVKWCFDHLGKRFFLVGSDYVFPRTANAIIKDQVGALGGEIVGEEYILLGERQAEGVAEKIARARPSVILNTINGDSNIAFFHALRKRGLAPAQIPVMSFSIAEREVASIGPALMAGDYAAWNYFQSLSTPQNQEFVQRFQASLRRRPRRVRSNGSRLRRGTSLGAGCRGGGDEPTARRSAATSETRATLGPVAWSTWTAPLSTPGRLSVSAASGPTGSSTLCGVRSIPCGRFRTLSIGGKLNGMTSSSRSTRAGAGAG